jgi:hypothetical protein
LGSQDDPDHDAVALAAPDLRLEDAISGGVEALGEEEVAFGLGVDVGDAPAVGDDFCGPGESGEVQGGLLGFGVLEVVVRRRMVGGSGLGVVWPWGGVVLVIKAGRMGAR